MRKITADAALAERLVNAAKARIRKLYDPRVTGARYVERLKRSQNDVIEHRRRLPMAVNDDREARRLRLAHRL
jgi:hypothetical protein